MTNEKIISDVLLFMDENKRTRADGRFLPMHGRQILRAGIARDGYKLIERLHHPIAEKVKGLIRRTLSNPSLLIELIHDLV